MGEKSKRLGQSLGKTSICGLVRMLRRKQQEKKEKAG